MPASAVPLVARHCTRARPRSGCVRLMTNTAATELSVVTIDGDSNEISLNAAGGVDGFAGTSTGDAAAGGSNEGLVDASLESLVENAASLPGMGGSASLVRSTEPTTELVSGGIEVGSLSGARSAVATLTCSSGPSCRCAAMAIIAIAQATNAKNPQPRCAGMSSWCSSVATTVPIG